MPGEGIGLVHCYNRGCGQTFDPQKNTEDSCIFHPGAPFFHDAYKGWSCCKKKCTDFTEFLNIKGCTKSFHSNVKPPEPEKPEVDKSNPVEEIEYKPPEPVVQALERPPFDSLLVKLKPDVAPALAKLAESLSESTNSSSRQESTQPLEIPIGTSCKNNGCKQVYERTGCLETSCTHHPGYPVFHEGLKFWTCCQRRTTDFNSFLEQAGCATGSHVWFKEKQGSDQQVNCRYDWHQTASSVVVSVFAKKYDPIQSYVQLNPIRLKLHLYFPEEGGAFDLDLELRRIVDVAKSAVSMLQTKVEVKLRKAEPGSWSNLDFPRQCEQKEEGKAAATVVDNLVPPVEAVDLSDL